MEVQVGSRRLRVWAVSRRDGSLRASVSCQRSGLDFHLEVEHRRGRWELESPNGLVISSGFAPELMTTLLTREGENHT